MSVIIRILLNLTNKRIFHCKIIRGIRLFCSGYPRWKINAFHSGYTNVKITFVMIAIIISGMSTKVAGIPILNLNGGPVVKIKQNGHYTDRGATAFDHIDGVISANVKRKGEVKTKKPGIYTLTYKVANKRGEWVSKNRLVIVGKSKGQKNAGMKKDKICPEIEFSGDSIVTILKGGTYEEPAIHAKDNVDGDVTEFVGTAGEADPRQQGLYEIIYYVKDKAENVAFKKFYVKVVLEKQVHETEMENIATENLMHRFKEQKSSKKNWVYYTPIIAITAGAFTIGLIDDFVTIPNEIRKYNAADNLTRSTKTFYKVKTRRNWCYGIAGVGAIALAVTFTIPEL